MGGSHGRPVLVGSIGSASSEAAGLDKEHLSKAGSIQVIIGPMFAGKTKELLRSVNFYKVCYIPSA